MSRARSIRRLVVSSGVSALVVAGAVLGMGLRAANASAADDDAPVLRVSTTTVSGTDTYSFTFVEPQYCPGDSNKGYLVQTFITPQTQDPATLTYELGIPKGSTFTAALRDSTGSWIRNENPGLTDGLVVPPHDATLSGPAYDALTPGDYLVGIACTKQGVDNVTRTVRYWAARASVSRVAAKRAPMMVVEPAARLTVAADTTIAGATESTVPMAADAGVTTTTVAAAPVSTEVPTETSVSFAETSSTDPLTVDTAANAGGSSGGSSNTGWWLVWLVVIGLVGRIAYLLRRKYRGRGNQ